MAALATQAARSGSRKIRARFIAAQGRGKSAATGPGGLCCRRPSATDGTSLQPANIQLPRSMLKAGLPAFRRPGQLSAPVPLRTMHSPHAFIASRLIEPAMAPWWPTGEALHTALAHSSGPASLRSNCTAGCPCTAGHCPYKNIKCHRRPAAQAAGRRRALRELQTPPPDFLGRAARIDMAICLPARPKEQPTASGGRRPRAHTQRDSRLLGVAGYMSSSGDAKEPKAAEDVAAKAAPVVDPEDGLVSMSTARAQPRRTDSGHRGLGALRSTFPSPCWCG